MSRPDAVLTTGVWEWQIRPDEITVPLVATEYPPNPSIRAAYVLLDYRASGQMAAQHLTDAGFRHLTYWYMGSSWALDAQRDGFEQAARDAGATVHELDWSKRGPGFFWDYADQRRWLVQHVSAMPKPLGLFVDSDWTALDALAALDEAAIAVPEEVAVISCYNIEPICEGASVPLTSIDMDWHAQGYQAAAVLDGMLKGKRPPRKPVYVAPREVVVRQSSDVTAVAHPGVAKAMQIIRQRYGDPELTIQRLADDVGISIIALNKAFKKHLGCSPSTRLRQRRIRAVEELLKSTKLHVKEIAARCGYGTVNHMIYILRQATGLSPTAWRRTFTANIASRD
ncbi:MAG: substrate-binding domain-containing protein [Planctomycetaceae bacterium]|nr:substrate-binding domain-containing protein [Planctomycetaceae bacterium]